MGNSINDAIVDVKSIHHVRQPHTSVSYCGFIMRRKIIKEYDPQYTCMECLHEEAIRLDVERMIELECR